MGHDEPEQIEERKGLPREEVIVETVGVSDLRGVKQLALRAHPHDTSPLTSWSDRSGNLSSVSQCAGTQIAG